MATIVPRVARAGNQYADAIEEILDEGTGRVDTEVIFHVRLQLRCAPCHHRRHHSPAA